jgi:hypothetical protein
MNITVDISGIDSITYSIYSSPRLNNARLLRNNINVNSLRLYAKATIYNGLYTLNNYAYYSHIFDYIRHKYKIDVLNVAFLYYIETYKNKLINMSTNNKKYTYINSNQTVRNKTRKLVKYNNIVQCNNTRKKFKHSMYNGIVLSKGYGKKILDYIERDLVSRDYKIIILIPIDIHIITYYRQNGYLPLGVYENIDKEGMEVMYKLL